jgi:hypothetical protein
MPGKILNAEQCARLSLFADKLHKVLTCIDQILTNDEFAWARMGQIDRVKLRAEIDQFVWDVEQLTASDWDDMRGLLGSRDDIWRSLHAQVDLGGHVMRKLRARLDQFDRGSPDQKIISDDILPPFAAKLLSYVVPPGRLEEALGDLEQGFRRLCQCCGRAHAVRWFYWHVAGIAIGGLMTGLYRWRWLLMFFTSH